MTASPIASLRVGDQFIVADFVLRFGDTTPEFRGEPKSAVVSKVGTRWLYAEWTGRIELDRSDLRYEVGPFDRATRKAHYWSRTDEHRLAFTDMADLDTWVFTVGAARTLYDRIQNLSRDAVQNLPPEALGELADWLDHWGPAT